MSLKKRMEEYPDRLNRASFALFVAQQSGIPEIVDRANKRFDELLDQMTKDVQATKQMVGVIQDPKFWEEFQRCLREKGKGK